VGAADVPEEDVGVTLLVGPGTIEVGAAPLVGPGITDVGSTETLVVTCPLEELVFFFFGVLGLQAVNSRTIKLIIKKVDFSSCLYYSTLSLRSFILIKIVNKNPTFLKISGVLR